MLCSTSFPSCNCSFEESAESVACLEVGLLAHCLCNAERWRDGLRRGEEQVWRGVLERVGAGDASQQARSYGEAHGGMAMNMWMFWVSGARPPVEVTIHAGALTISA